MSIIWRGVRATGRKAIECGMRRLVFAWLASWMLLGLAQGSEHDPNEEPLHPVCQRLQDEQPVSLAERVALGAQAWKRHGCYQLAHDLLTQGAEDATRLGQQALAFDALLVLADMHWESTHEEWLEKTLEQMKGLVLALSDSGMDERGRLREHQIRYYEAELMMLRGRYRAALEPLGQIIEDVQRIATERPEALELLALAHGSRAFALRMSVDDPERIACKQDADKAIGLATDQPGAILALGRGYKNRGRCERTNALSLPWYQQGYAQCLKVHAAACAADLLNMIAMTYRERGEYSVALNYYWRALEFSRAFGLKTQTSLLLNNKANLELRIGRTSAAHDSIREAIDLQKRFGRPFGLSYRYIVLGRIYLLEGKARDSVEPLREALLIRERFNATEIFQVRARYALAEALFAAGEEVEAVMLLGGQHDRAQALGFHLDAAKIAVILAANTPQVNKEQLLRAALAAESHGEAEVQWSALKLLAQQLAQEGKATQAIFFGKTTVNLIQKSRSDLRELDELTQAAFIAKFHDFYLQLANWLVRAGRLAEAEQVLAMLKDEESKAYTVRSVGKADALSLTDEERLMQADLMAVGKPSVEQATELRRLERRPSQELGAAERLRLSELRAWQRAQAQQLDAFFARIQPRLSPDAEAAQALRDAAQRRVSPMESVLDQAGEGHVGLTYLLAPESLTIITSLANTSFATEVPIGRQAISELIFKFRAALRDPRANPEPAAKALHDVLIKPVAEALKSAKAHTLVLALSGDLRYVPFAALHDGQSYLIERWAVAHHSPSGQLGRKGDASQWRVAGLGVTRAVTLPDLQHAFSALPAVASEISAVVRTDTSPMGALPGVIALDEAFGEEAFRQALRGTSVVHVASHFRLTPGSRDNSYLLLGDQTRLSLSDIQTMSFAGTQLVTLSACDTAQSGGRGGYGSEIEGLAAAVQSKGAQAVLATLWPVADSSTAHLMSVFYRHRSGEQSASHNTARSLQHAQLSLIRGTVESAEVSPVRGARLVGQQPEAVRSEATPYRHPYHWAPFVLMGNWL